MLIEPYSLFRGVDMNTRRTFARIGGFAATLVALGAAVAAAAAAVARGRQRRLLEVRADHVPGLERQERRLTAEQLVEDHPQRPQVGRVVVRLFLHQLGRHQCEEPVAKKRDQLLGERPGIQATRNRVSDDGQRTSRVAFDHRLDELVERLRAEHPTRGVNFVAHSMGGLVVRAFIAEHRQRWDELADIPGASSGRLVMLGTPNRGSYSIPMTLLGAELAVRGLAAIDRRHDGDEVAKIVAGFPGVYQMLPFAQGVEGVEDDHWNDLYTAAKWGDGSHISADLLARAKATHEQLSRDGVHAERTNQVVVGLRAESLEEGIRVPIAAHPVDHLGAGGPDLISLAPAMVIPSSKVA